MQENRLTNRQIKTIVNFLASSSIEETCRKSKISKATFYKWIKDDDFKSFLEEKRNEMIKGALDKLKLAIEKAVSVLIDLMLSGNESIRRLASKDIIEYVLKSIELENIEDRLNKIERLISEKRSYQ
ncbi:phBC6A51 family helix-turn-helix protein [Candidatus Omnitrophota bacterium]